MTTNNPADCNRIIKLGIKKYVNVCNIDRVNSMKQIQVKTVKTSPFVSYASRFLRMQK